MSIIRKVFLLVFLLSVGGTIQAQLEVSPNRPDASYQAGESMSFHIASNESGMVKYTIWHDRFTSVLAQGEVMHTAGVITPITFQLGESGIVMCVVEQNGQRAITGGAFSPYDMQPLEDEPADFDAFWQGEIASMRALPLNPQIFFLTKNQYSTTYQLRLDHLDGRKIHGYMVVPDGQGPFPAFLTLPSYGITPGIVQPEIALAERTNAISVYISIHNAPPDQTDLSAYMPDVINDRKQLYHRYAILAGIRTIDYMASRPDFDNETVAAFGVSQGGGLATMVAGLDERVKLIAISNPSHCQHLGLKYDQASGFPYYLIQSIGTDGSAEHYQQTLDATKYIDAVYFAKRYKGPVFAYTSLRDETAPASSQQVAINQFKGEKIHLIARDLVHDETPDQYWQGRLDFIRQHIPAAFNAPWPWGDKPKSFSINLGEDREVGLGESLQLGANALFNEKIIFGQRYEWRQEEGPGTVTFSSPNSNNSNITFSEPGSYLLSLSSFPDTLNNQGLFYRLTDYVRVEVTTSLTTNEEEVASVNLYPNPANDLFQLEIKAGKATSYDYQIESVNGQRMQNGQFEGTTTRISTREFPAGAYQLRLYSKDRYILSTRFMVLR